MSTPDDVSVQLDPQVRLRASARGWSGIQIALMGFIGLCGVLQTPGGPYLVEVTGGLLALAALVAAVLGAVLVALVAWPLSESDTPRASGLLRAGVAQVEVADAAGRTACGELAGSGDGSVTLRIDGRPVAIRLKSLAALRTVSDCA